MTYHNTDNLKLEIEVDPTGLPNLVQNPSGDKGSWGWVTPIANTTVSADYDPDHGNILTMYTGSAVAVNWTTEFMPVAAGKYVAAQFTVAFNDTNVTMKPRFEWYDSNKVLLSSSTQGSAASGYKTTWYYAAVVAPANTAYVKLRFDMYNAGGTPQVDDYISYSKVMVTWANTTGEIGSLRENLVPNPNFEVDTLGWTSTTATLARTTSTFSSGTASLSVTFSDNGDYVYSPMFAVTGGSTYSAQIKTKAATTARIPNVYFYWYDSGGVFISSSTPGASTNNTSTWTTTKNENKTAPSNAAFARLRIYDNGIPSGEVHYFDDVMVEVGSTAGTYFDGSSTSGGGVTYTWGTNKVYTNLITNPSAESNTTGWSKWTAYGSTPTLSRTTAQSKFGSASLDLTGSTGEQYMGLRTARGTSGMPVTPGVRYYLNFWARATSGITGTSNSVGGNIAFYDSAGNYLADPYTEDAFYHLEQDIAPSTWVEAKHSEVAPAGAAYAAVHVGIKRGDGTNITNTANFNVDGVYFGTEDVTSFDGSFTDTATLRDYAWTGTTNNSTSTLTAPTVSTRTETAAFEFTEPVEWRNILGPTHEIKIQRQELDVGLLSATILDALLDPAIATVIRPGKKVRVQALVDDVWTDLFNGVVSNAHVTYDKEKIAGSEVETRIELSASDAIAHLANQGEVRGIEDIDDLPYILEGKGVPWSVNGSGNQVTSASIVSYNDNASVLDQVAITRDTNHGYVWVDRHGVLVANDSDYMGDEIEARFADALPAVTTVTNGGFESTDISGWYSYYPGYATFSRDTTIMNGGTASLKVTQAGYDLHVENENMGVGVPGEWYEFTADVRVPSLTVYGGEYMGRIGMYIAGYNVETDDWSSFAWDDIYPDDNSLANTWVTLRASGPFPEGYDRLAIGFTLYDYNASGPYPVWYIDNITSVTPTSEPLGYTDIDVDFDLDRCINSVMVNWLRYDIGSSTTTEIPYGPYENPTSITTYGARSATFTIHGATESGASIATFANNVLTTNATPQVRTNSLTMPVRDAAEMAVAANLDLYSYVSVWFDEKQEGEGYRITGIEHNITPEKWSVNYSFAGSSSVAAPTWTPSPPMQPVEENVAVLNPVGAITMFAAATAPDGWLLCEGGTFSSVDYPELAALLGDTYGVHSGTTYYLPNFSAKFPRGGTPGGTGGSNTVTLTDTNLPPHTHGASAITVPTSSGTSGGSSGARLARGTATAAADATPLTGVTGTGTGLNSTPVTVTNPYLNIKFIIKADA